MSELKREVRGEIQANLVPPPQQDVWGEALKSVIQVDATMQSAKLLKEQDLERERQMNEGMQAQIEVQQATANRTADASIVFGDNAGSKTGDGGEVVLSDADQQDLAEIRSSMKRNKDGMMQGATSHTESLINQELILKRAIQRRPWLRDEFIKASTGFLGVDVYQRGYMALAENEAARLTASDAATKAEHEALSKQGDAIFKDGWVTAFIAANPDRADIHQQLLAIQYDPVKLAQFYNSSMGTPEGINANNTLTQKKVVNSAAQQDKDFQSLQQTEITNFLKDTNTQFINDFNTSIGNLVNDAEMWGPDGIIKPERQGQLKSALDAMLLSLIPYEAALVGGRVDGTVAKSYVDIHKSNIQDMINLLTGGTGEKINQAQLTAFKTQAAIAMATSPAVAAVANLLMKENPGLTDPGMVQMQASMLIGANGGNPQAILKHLTSPLGNSVSTMLKNQARRLQDKALTPMEKAVAQDTLKNLGFGTVVNLSSINSRDMATTFSAIGQARQQLTDFSDAFLANEKVGEKNGAIFFDLLGEGDQAQVGGAFAKSVYKLQEAIAAKSSLNSDLAAFRKNNLDGTPAVIWGEDGSLIIKDESAFRSGNPQEQAYLQEIKEHNRFIERSKAKEIITNTLGREPTLQDRKVLLAASFGVSNYTGASKAAWTATTAAIFGKGGDSKKPQGATAPTGTRVFKSDDRDSRIGYAEGLRGAESGSNFNIQYGGKKVPVTDMTVGQVLAYQEGQRAQGKQTAIGAYQFTQDTLKDAMKRAGIPETARFDHKTQNAIMKSHSEYLAQEAKSALGRDPSYGEMYLLHFQGAGDGKAMLAAGPNASVDAWFSPAEKAKNPAYAKAKTVGDLIRILDSKWS